MLAKFALKKKLISEDECQKAIDACKFSENFEESLKNYFIKNNLISPSVLDQLIKTIASIRIIQKNRKFGAVAVEMGFIDTSVLEEALDGQKKRAANNNRPKLIGQILMESGHLTKDQVDRVIAEQNNRRAALKSAEKQVKPEAQKKPVDASAPDPETKPQAEPQVEPQVEPQETSEKPASRFETSNTTEKVQGGLILEIEDNGLSAYLRKTKKFSNVMTADDLFDILQTRNIQYGIQDEGAVEGFINSRGFETNRFKIASGRPARPGRNARIEYYFDTDHLWAGKLDEKGNIDFKNRGPTPKVEANTLLAQKFPYRESKPGRDIFGNELIAEPAADRSLKIESGVFLSEDQTKVYAQISGHPVLDWSGNISVLDVFIVRNNVGYKTGHVHYDGDVDVQGGLKDGFRIDGANIDILEIDGGEIYAKGDVRIAKGVNNAKIYSRGHVTAQFFHNSQIYCLGDVMVEKEIVDSKIESSGACRMETGNVVNSKLSFNQGIHAKNIGTEKTSPNIIRIGQGLFIKRELKEIDDKIADFENRITSLAKKKETLLFENENLSASAAQSANKLDKALKDRQQIEIAIQKIKTQASETKQIQRLEEDLKHYRLVFSREEKDFDELFYQIETNRTKIKDITNSIETMKEQIADLNQKKINFTNWREINAGKPVMSVNGKIFSGTLIHTPHAQKEIKEIMTNVQIIESVLQISDGGTDIHEIQINDAAGRR